MNNDLYEKMEYVKDFIKEFNTTNQINYRKFEVAQNYFDEITSVIDKPQYIDFKKSHELELRNAGAALSNIRHKLNNIR